MGRGIFSCLVLSEPLSIVHKMCRPFFVYRGDLVEHFANFVAINYSYADLVERFFLLLFCVVMVEMFYRFVRSLAFLTLEGVRVVHGVVGRDRDVPFEDNVDDNLPGGEGVGDAAQVAEVADAPALPAIELAPEVAPVDVQHDVDPVQDVEIQPGGRLDPVLRDEHLHNVQIYEARPPRRVAAIAGEAARRLAARQHQD